MDKTILHLSHSARRGDDSVEWFIVEPRHDPVGLRRQLNSLRQAGRKVIRLVVEAKQVSEPATVMLEDIDVLDGDGEAGHTGDQHE